MSLGIGYIAAAFVLSFGLVELALRLPLAQAATRVLGPVNRARHVMTTRGISDHWKEKVLLVYARRTLSGVGMLVLCMACIVIPAALLTVLLDTPLPGFVGFMTSYYGLVVTFAAAGLYLKFRRRMTHVQL